VKIVLKVKAYYQCLKLYFYFFFFVFSSHSYPYPEEAINLSKRIGCFAVVGYSEEAQNDLYKNIKSIIINILCLVFIVFLIYNFIIGLTVSRLYVFILSTIIAFIMSLYISKNIKFSSHLIIRILQKFVL
jgi:hypothetical protein